MNWFILYWCVLAYRPSREKKEREEADRKRREEKKRREENARSVILNASPDGATVGATVALKPEPEPDEVEPVSLEHRSQ